MAFAANRHDGTRIYYEVHGHGPPLVLYHGSATSSVVWHELGAAAAPDRLDSLVIGGGSHRPQRGALDRLFYPGYIDTIATEGIAVFLDAWASRLGRAIDPGVRALFLANDPAALVAYLCRTEEEPGFEDAVLARLERPVLLLAGDHDGERLEDARAAAARLPNAELVTIRDADHFSTPFRRREVVQQVKRFLRDVAR